MKRLALAVLILLAGCGAVATPAPSPTTLLLPVQLGPPLIIVAPPTGLPVKVVPPIPLRTPVVAPPTPVEVIILPTTRPIPTLYPKPPPPSPLYYNVTVQQTLINGDRAGHGLRPLAWSSCLASEALHVAHRIAAAEALGESYADLSADLACHVGLAAGENEGQTFGIQDVLINTLFVASPPHVANILGPYRFVGTAWVVASNGAGFIAVEFG